MAKQNAQKRRVLRTRAKIRQAAAKSGRPRLHVHRSGRHISAQVIDDVRGSTLAAASTMDADLRKKLKSGANRDAAVEVGKLVAERAKKAGVAEVVFDRGRFAFHGRVKALADSAREGGLQF